MSALDAEALAAIHAQAFTAPPPWSAASFAELLESPHSLLLASPCAKAFALLRIIGPEAELLTIATAPEARRQGLARKLMAEIADQARARHVEELFLEVAEDNVAARALYRDAGWVENGRRPNYYLNSDGKRIAAVLMHLKIA